MDIWGAGCIHFELTTLYPLFPGSDETDQIDRIHRVLGNPKAHTLLKLKRHASSHANFDFPRQEGIGLSKLLPDASSSYIDLLSRAVAYDTADRITSRQAVDHPYFETGKTAQSTIQSQNGRRGRRQIRNTLLSTNKAKVAPSPSIASSVSFPPAHAAKVDEASKAGGPDHSAQNVGTAVTKPRSMVSILLARSSQKEFSQENKGRNKTIYRRGKMPPKEAKQSNLHRGGGGAGPQNKNATSQSTRRRRRVVLPPKEAKQSNLHRGGGGAGPQNKNATSQSTRRRRFAHVRSSGYGGGTASTEPTSGSGGSEAPGPNTKLPPLPPLKEDLKQKHMKKRNGKGGRTKRLPPLARSGGYR